MTQPDSIWHILFNWEHVPGFKQKRRECKECKHQINNSLRSARTHFKNCTRITAAQKRSYLGNSYEGSDDNTSTSTNISTSVSKEADYISKAEQKSLELTLARSIFRCGLFLSLSKLEPIKELWQQARPAFKLLS